MRLASEKPEWLPPALQATYESPRKAEAYGGEFAGSCVISGLEQQTEPRLAAGLRSAAIYGLTEKSGQSTRGGRRAYYRMPDRPAFSWELSN